MKEGEGKQIDVTEAVMRAEITRRRCEEFPVGSLEWEESYKKLLSNYTSMLHFLAEHDDAIRKAVGEDYLYTKEEK